MKVLMNALHDKLSLNLIDSHAHLSEMDQMDAVIHRSRQAGVHRIVGVGMDMISNLKTIQIAGRYPETVLPAIGYHPGSICEDEMEKTIAFINKNLSTCCALGEVGLDYKVKIKKPLQRDVFKRVLSLAHDYGKPVIIHSRYSYERTCQMVSAAHIEKAVFHWYSGPLDILDCILERGYCISATPALMYSKHHQAAIAHAPLHQILIETDCPVEYRGKISEPGDLIQTLKALSMIKNEPMDVLGRFITENTKKFFALEAE